MSFQKIEWCRLRDLFTLLLQQRPVLVTELPAVGVPQNHSLSSSGDTTRKSIHLRTALRVTSGIAWCCTLSPTVTFQNKAGSKNKLMKVFEEGGGGLQLSLHPSVRAVNVCSCKVFLSFHLDTLGRCPPSPSYHKHTPVSRSPFLLINFIKFGFAQKNKIIHYRFLH